MPKENQLDQTQLLKEITSLLHKAHIPYMVTGALSVIFYGRPRASHDIDFVIEAEDKNVTQLIKTFSSLPHNEFPIDAYTIVEAVKHKHMFSLIHLPTVLKLNFFLLKNEAFDESRFDRRKTLTVFGQKMDFAAPEDTILIKLLWYKETDIEKHLIDAAFVYQIQKNELDMSYLNAWTKKHETLHLLEEIKNIDLQNHY